MLRYFERCSAEARRIWNGRGRYAVLPGMAADCIMRTIASMMFQYPSLPPKPYDPWLGVRFRSEAFGLLWTSSGRLLSRVSVWSSPFRDGMNVHWNPAKARLFTLATPVPTQSQKYYGIRRRRGHLYNTPCTPETRPSIYPQTRTSRRHISRLYPHYISRDPSTPPWTGTMRAYAPILLLSALVAAGDVPRAGEEGWVPFTEHCYDHQLVDGKSMQGERTWLIEGTCDVNGEQKQYMINPGACVGNDQGRLKWWKA